MINTYIIIETNDIKLQSDGDFDYLFRKPKGFFNGNPPIINMLNIKIAEKLYEEYGLLLKDYSLNDYGDQVGIHEKGNGLVSFSFDVGIDFEYNTVKIK